ncbi:MAG: DUF418 domain-containing protein [Rikenellaceae bacterium]
MSTTKNSRIDVADVLRGFAVLGIILLHSSAHFNCFRFYDTTGQCALLNFTDKAIWDGLSFAFGGKAYAIFALLFGFSFYIQDSRQLIKGNDFRLRFCWRMVLLFIIGNINAIFFTGEVLVLYSIVGFIMPLTCRLSDRKLAILGSVLLMQPLHVAYIFIALFNPSFSLPAIPTFDFWDAAIEMQAEGNFMQMAEANLKYGQLASLAWAWDYGRIFQSAALFIFGMLIGRKTLFSSESVPFWRSSLAWSLVLFFPLLGLTGMMNSEFIANEVVATSLTMILRSLSNFAFMLLLVSSIIILYYTSNRPRAVLAKLIPYGRMSLTNYLTQGMVGAFIFYNWGLGLYDDIGITYGLCVGILLFALQYAMCRVWLQNHKQGPFEYLWRRATWIGVAKK